MSCIKSLGKVVITNFKKPTYINFVTTENTIIFCPISTQKFFNVYLNSRVPKVADCWKIDFACPFFSLD